jgi:hypothetical protein
MRRARGGHCVQFGHIYAAHHRRSAVGVFVERRRRLLKQTLALTHICSELGDLAFGPKAGTQKAIRMKPLEPARR